MNPTIEVAAAIIEKDGHILITQRRQGGYWGGFWEFPGGKRHADESLEECLRREIREELGVEISLHGLRRRIDYTYPDRFVQLHFYSCRIISGELRKLEVEDFRWVKPAELTEFTFVPADVELIAELAQKK